MNPVFGRYGMISFEMLAICHGTFGAAGIVSLAQPAPSANTTWPQLAHAMR